MTGKQSKLAYGFEIQQDDAAGNKSGLRYTFYMDPPDIRVISFKGGGVRVFVYSKFLEVAHKNGLLNTVEEVGGSSSGCIAATFAAVHYENPLKRTAALTEISSADRSDVYADTQGWRLFQIITKPLLQISGQLGWVSKSIDRLTDLLSTNLLGKILRLSLRIISSLISIAGTIISPRTIGGIYNLFTSGGVYRGDVVQAAFRKRLQMDTEAGLNAILQKLTPEQRHEITGHLLDIGLYEMVGDKARVVADITFNHLYELSKLPGSQFKQLYITAARVRDKMLIIYNREKHPHTPIHVAFRHAITFPLYYMKKSHKGDFFIDGGAIDNAPVIHARPGFVSGFERQHNIKDDYMARLNVRVEYDDEYKFNLWRKPPVLSLMGKVFAKIGRSLAKLIASGIDVFGKDDAVTRNMQTKFAQRTLQIPDFDVGRMAELKKEEMDSNGQRVEVIVNEYFRLHNEEKSVIENYRHPGEMDMEKRLLLLHYLEDTPASEIYYMPGKSPSELECMRQAEIKDIRKLCYEGAGRPVNTCPRVNATRASTSAICQAFNSASSELSNAKTGIYEAVDLSATGNNVFLEMQHAECNTVEVFHDNEPQSSCRI